MRNRNANTLIRPDADCGGAIGRFLAGRQPPRAAAIVHRPGQQTPFPGNVIPQSRISTQATDSLEALPAAELSRQHPLQLPDPECRRQRIHDGVQTNLNKTINTKDQVFGTFAYQRTNGTTPNIFDFRRYQRDRGPQRQHQSVIIVSPTGFSRASDTSYSRYSARTTPYFANRENISGEAGITGNNQDPLNWGPPSLSFSSGIAGLSDAAAVFHPQSDQRCLLQFVLESPRPQRQFGGDSKAAIQLPLATEPARHVSPSPAQPPRPA